MVQHRDGETPSSYAILVGIDPIAQFSLVHFFCVVCEQDVKTLPHMDAALRALESGQRPRILVVGGIGQHSDSLGLISATVAMPNPPYIVALDTQNNPKNSVEAFLAGADDVVRSPFTIKEFGLRLRAHMARPGEQLFDREFFDAADWDTEAFIVSRAGLTSAEAQVAHVLITHNGRIVTRDELSRAIDDRPWSYGERKFDVHVAKIRKKLNVTFGEKISVSTVRSAGYRLTLDAPELGYQHSLSD